MAVCSTVSTRLTLACGTAQGNLNRCAQGENRIKMPSRTARCVCSHKPHRDIERAREDEQRRRHLLAHRQVQPTEARLGGATKARQQCSPLLQKAFVTLSGQPDRAQAAFLSKHDGELERGVAAYLKHDLAGYHQLVLGQSIDALPPAHIRGDILRCARRVAIIFQGTKRKEARTIRFGRPL